MRVSTGNAIRAAVPLLLVAQAAFTALGGLTERWPAAPDPARFPAATGEWRLEADSPIPGDMLAALKADRVVNQVYRDRSGIQAGLFVAWFQSQRGGERQPHSPKVCLPGSGWTLTDFSDTALATRAGPITASRVVAATPWSRTVFLYWYQTPRRVVSGEWAAKFWLVADALRDRRTDAALVRIDVNAAALGDARASEAAARFAREVYPWLREWLPR